MDDRFKLISWALAAFALFFAIFFKIISGGMINYLQAAMLFVPIILIIFLNCRAVWHILILLSIVALRLRFSMYGLQQFTPMLVVSLLLLGFLILDTAMGRGERVRLLETWEDKTVFALAVFLTMRMIYDRPGFAALGMESGGFFKAVNYVAGAWIYFAVQRVAAIAKFTRKQIRVSSVIVFLFFIYALVYKHFMTSISFTRVMGEQESWMLIAMLLALIATSSVNGKTVKFYIVAFAFLLMAAISTYRARVFYLLSEVLAISYLTKKLRRTVVVLGVAGALLIVFVVSFPQYMPSSMGRFLSLFVEIESHESIGAYGWEDSFRGQLYKMAWEQIKKHPVLGRGFGLNVEEALSVLAVSNSATALQINAWGGAYHNSIVALAVIAGLPVAFLLAVTMISILLKFVRMLKKVPGGAFFTWGLVIAGFSCSVISMLLLNGGDREFYYLMIVMGYMSGMMKHESASKTVYDQNH